VAIRDQRGPELIDVIVRLLMAGSSSVTGQLLTTWMKVTIALLGVYVLTLVIEVPIWLYLFYGGRGMRWSYVGAMVVGIVHAIYSASIVLMEPWGEPLGYFNWPDAKALGLIAVFLTVLPALLAIAAALAVLELRKRAPS